MKIRIKDSHFESLSEALESIPYNNKNNISIFIEGYVEGQTIIDRPNITIHGGTFINDYGAYEMMSDGKKRGTFNSYTLYVNADNVTLENTRIFNTSGKGNGQAIALMIDGDNTVLKSCRITSYQDTLFIGPLPEKEFEPDGFKGPLKDKERLTKHAYFRNCLIEGSVDYVFGSGFAYFENCAFNSLAKGYVFAPSTKAEEKYGFIVNKCNFTSELEEECVYLGRPWRNGAKLLISKSTMGPHILKEGYTDWNKDMTTVEFKEDGEVSERKYITKFRKEDYTVIEKLKNINK